MPDSIIIPTHDRNNIPVRPTFQSNYSLILNNPQIYTTIDSQIATLYIIKYIH